MEKTRLKENLDLFYSSRETPWGKNPDPLVEMAATSLKKGTIVDIGAGDGRNSLFLAGQGFNVTGIDLSIEAIRRLNKHAARSGIHYSTEVSDISDYRFNKHFDNILCILVLHYLEHEEAVKTIERMSNAVSLGGLIVLKSFTDQGELVPENNFGFWPSQKEIANYFEDNGYETVHYDIKNYETLFLNQYGERCIQQAEEMIFKRSS